MKQIFFIRHAKSSWEDMSLKDIDRPLNKRGKKDAAFMAKKLAEKIDKVDLIICSPAKRARQTCANFTKIIDFKEKIIEDEVYDAWTDTLVGIIRGIENKVDVALIYGHNPGFTSVFNRFSQKKLDNLPTCGIFELKVGADWSSVSPQNTVTGMLMYPKMYTND